jgi:hypothetical protein
MLPDEPLVPSASERNRVELGERLTFAVTLSTQRGDARFNLRRPFSELRLCLVVRGVPWQSQMRFPAHAIEPSIWIAYVFRDALAGEPTTVFRST